MFEARRSSSFRCAAPLSGSNEIAITRAVNADPAQSANDADSVSPQSDGLLDNPTEVVFELDLNLHVFTSIQPLSGIRVCQRISWERQVWVSRLQFIIRMIGDEVRPQGHRQREECSKRVLCSGKAILDSADSRTAEIGPSSPC